MFMNLFIFRLIILYGLSFNFFPSFLLSFLLMLLILFFIFFSLGISNMCIYNKIYHPVSPSITSPTCSPTKCYVCLSFFLITYIVQFVMFICPMVWGYPLEYGHLPLAAPTPKKNDSPFSAINKMTITPLVRSGTT